MNYFLGNKYYLLESFIEENILYKLLWYFTTITINVAIFFAIVKSSFTFSILITSLISGLISTTLFYSFVKEKIDEFNIRENEKKNKKYRVDIEKTYERNFKNTKYENIFDKKVFTIIDILTSMSDKNLSGVLKQRIDGTLYSSLKLYLINLETASKMIETERKAELDFSTEILNILEQNSKIIEILKEFITKIVTLDISDKKFNDLMYDFERTMSNINAVKKFREEA